MKLHRIDFLLLALACLPVGMTAFSLESDKNQAVIYESLGRSTSRIEGDVRIVTLEDNVKVTQGTLEISGDDARFESEAQSSAIRRITVNGTPARYRQQLDVDGDHVEGESESIFYYVEGEPVVEFIGSAILRGSNDILRCAAIKYYTDSRFTETTGPCEGVSGSAATSSPGSGTTAAN